MSVYRSSQSCKCQRIRDAERNNILNEFLEKKGTLTTGIIQRVENRNVIVNIGKTDAIMPQNAGQLSHLLSHIYVKKD